MMGSAKDLATFYDEVVPILLSKSPMGHKSGAEFITDYEYYRPIVNFRVTHEHIPQRHDQWNRKEARIADKMWGVIAARVKQHLFFGLAVDGGVDEVRSRYILVMVIYVAGESFELPPVYEASGKAFNGTTTGGVLYDVLTSRLGNGDDGVSLCVRLRFLIVDGCGVNHCARDDLSKRFMAMLLRPIAEKDWTNMMAVFLTKVANISLLSCQGHFMNNVAKDAMKPWLDTLIFQIWRSFKHVFFKCGKSAKKGRYGVVSLETMSECWNEETEGAVTLFEKELQQDVLRSNFLTGTLKAKQIENLSAALKILVRVTGERTTSDKPTVVTQCDSMLSVMGAKFNRRQAHLAPHVAANQLFMRCNWRYLLPKKESENQPATMINFTSSSKKKTFLLSFPFGFSIVIYYLG